jgi:hypothetical protein
MIYETAFSIVGITAFVTIFYLQWKLFSMALTIRERNFHFIGKGWNGRASVQGYKNLLSITKDDESKKIIKMFSKHRKMQIVVLVGSFSLFLIIGFLNSKAVH